MMTEEEKPKQSDTKLPPQNVLNEFIDRINDRMRFEEKVEFT